jgi:hypothetical protein
MRTSFFPSVPTSAKLFGFGATIGPLVDSLHNQCLLEYDFAPIALWPLSDSNAGYLFASSWAVPPLLGFAYVVLGGLLPPIFERLTGRTKHEVTESSVLGIRAILAVMSTALIIKLSELLETNPSNSLEFNLLVMLACTLCQWALLDGTLAALVTASMVSIGGPLSELPFVAHGFWHYLDGDYLPLQNVHIFPLEGLLGPDYQSLSLSSITGPCYFAVTMDAIALGRWLDSKEDDFES